MKRFVLSIAVSVLFCNSAYASAVISVPEPPARAVNVDGSREQAAPLPIPTPTPPPVPATPTRGISFYPEYPKVPDFMAFANMKPGDCIEYPTYVDIFSFISNSPENYVYSSKAYDYKNAPAEKVEQYKDYLKRFDYKHMTLAEAGAKIGHHFDAVKQDLLYDPEFWVFDVFLVDYVSEFTLVVIGKSNVYENDTRIVCDQIRIYDVSAKKIHDEFEILPRIPAYSEDVLKILQELPTFDAAARYLNETGLYMLLSAVERAELRLRYPWLQNFDELLKYVDESGLGNYMRTNEAYNKNIVDVDPDIIEKLNQLEHFLVYPSR